MNFVLFSLLEGLLWLIMVIGVYLIFCILDIVDMIVEGVFFLGAVVVVFQIQVGINFWIVILFVLLVGMVVGFVLGMFYIKMKILVFLIGIVILIGFYFINIKIMGSVFNFFLGDFLIVFKQLVSLGLINEEVVFLFSLVCFLFVCLVLIFLMKIEIGLVLCLIGDNILMSEVNGVNVDIMKIVGYMILNGLIVLCGFLFV